MSDGPGAEYRQQDSMEDVISQLRAEVERLTKERDVYAQCNRTALDGLDALRAQLAESLNAAEIANDALKMVEMERDRLADQLAEREEDRAAMDMLELHEVEVRIPLRHGSRLAFRCSPVQEDEGDEDQPSNLRAAIRAARAQPEEKAC